MQHSILKLTVEKGPRSGETLDCKPRSTIRIGRVVKGNSFTIKDDGISSNHLRVEFDFKGRKWVLVDLDTSNGTILNETQIEGMQAVGLRDGDLIKIGEFTTLKVGIEGNEEEVKKEENVGSVAVNRPRRGGKKAGKGGKVECLEGQKVESVGEKLNLEVDSGGVEEEFGSLAVGRSRGGRGRGRGIGRGQGRGRGRVHKGNEEQSVEVCESEKVQMVSESSNFAIESHGEEVSFGGSLAVNRPRRGAARATRSTKVDSLEVSETQKVRDEMNLDEVAPAKQKRTRAASKRGKNSDDETVVSEVPTKPPNFNQDSPKEAQDVRLVEEASEVPMEPAQSDLQKEAIVESNVDNKPAQSDLQKEAIVESNVDNKPDNANAGGSTSGIDWEKMTLGEWFDYLEVYLPKQIHEHTDIIVVSMREKAKKFNEFMTEQQNLKGKSPLP